MSFLSFLANQGSSRRRKSYVASNATLTVAGDIAINADPTAVAATEAMIVLQNSASRTGTANKNTIIVPRYIKLTCSVTAASGTDFAMFFKKDIIERYASGGTELVGYGTYADTSSSWTERDPLGECYFGDITAKAESAAKVVGTSWIRTDTAGPLADDKYLIVFGEPDAAHVGTAATQSLVKDFVSPIYLGPGTSLVVHPLITAAASTAAEFYVEIGWDELGHDRD